VLWVDAVRLPLGLRLPLLLIQRHLLIGRGLSTAYASSSTLPVVRPASFEVGRDGGNLGKRIGLLLASISPRIRPAPHCLAIRIAAEAVRLLSCTGLLAVSALSVVGVARSPSLAESPSRCRDGRGAGPCTAEISRAERSKRRRARVSYKIRF
jgi:hypothetical protein